MEELILTLLQWHTKKIFLIPVTHKPTIYPHPKPTKTLFITSNGTEFQNSIKKSDYLVGLPLKDHKEPKNTFSPLVQPLPC